MLSEVNRACSCTHCAYLEIFVEVKKIKTNFLLFVILPSYLLTKLWRKKKSFVSTDLVCSESVGVGMSILSLNIIGRFTFVYLAAWLFYCKLKMNEQSMNPL